MVLNNVPAPDGSTWVDSNPKAGEEARWENTRNGDALVIRQTGDPEPIPEAGWIGSSAMTDGQFTVDYPDGLSEEYNGFEEAKQTALDWMKQYPDQSGEYGAL